MKQQIEKLIELANEYYEFAVDVKLHELKTHVHKIRGRHTDHDWTLDGLHTQIYINDGIETWSIQFGNVDISDYSKKIELPYNVDEALLEKIHSDAMHYLYNHLLINKRKIKISVKKQIKLENK
jgi:hypothetical protein